MRDTLIKKYLNWSIEKTDQFHNFAIRGNLDGLYTWEKDPNGFYMCRNQGVIYCSNEGVVYILTIARNTEDWKSHLLLYEQIKNSSCRIDIPVEYEEFYMDDVPLYYIVFERPNRQIGIDYHRDIFDGKVNDQYFLQYIEDASILIDELKTCNKKHNILFPELGVTVFKRVFDTKGCFWIDFKRWKNDYQFFIQRTYDTLEAVIFYLEHNNIGIYNKELILNTAKEKWKMV